MFRSARVAGAPIHPMIVVVPVVLFAAAIAALLAYLGTRDTFYYRAAMTASAAGVTMAMLAIIPGVLELVALPRGSEARTVGLRRGGFVVLAIGIFAVATAVMVRNWIAREHVDGVWEIEATVPLAISVAGMVTAVILGALGTVATPMPATPRRAPLAFHPTLLARH